MQTARRRRTTWAIAGSVIAHLAVLLVLALQKPQVLAIPVEDAGPPEPFIPLLLMPRTPPAASHEAPAPLRLHRRPQPFLPPDLPVAPIAPPAPPATQAAPSRAPPALHPAPQPEGPSGDVKTALRQSFVGCANPLAVGLNHAERELCDEKLGKGAKDAPFIPPGVGLSAGKRASFDKAAAEKDAMKAYTEAQGAPLQRPHESADYDGDPDTGGGAQSALGGPVTFSSSKRAAKKLKPLPP